MLADDILKMLYNRYKADKRKYLGVGKCKSCGTTHGVDKVFKGPMEALKYAFKHGMSLRRYERRRKRDEDRSKLKALYEHVSAGQTPPTPEELMAVKNSWGINMVAIGIGSNLGNRTLNVSQAVERLAGLGTITAVSSVIETVPVDPPDAFQRPYMNAVAILQTGLSPRSLLNGLMAIEKIMGRERVAGVKNRARTIDLDILLYGNFIVSEYDLQIPHPRMHERSFVLRPLAEVAPDWTHPKFDKATWNEILQTA